MVEKPSVRVASYLSPPDMHRLNWACRPVRYAFDATPYLVGSVLLRPDFRDIDVRLILADDVVDRMFGHGARRDPNEPPEAVRLLLNVALSDLIARAANLPWPIDFQIQSMTEANVPEHGPRNPLGAWR